MSGMLEPLSALHSCGLHCVTGAVDLLWATAPLATPSQSKDRCWWDGRSATGLSGSVKRLLSYLNRATHIMFYGCFTCAPARP